MRSPPPIRWSVSQRREPGAASYRLSRQLRLPATVPERDRRRLACPPVAARPRDRRQRLPSRRAGSRQRRREAQHVSRQPANRRSPDCWSTAGDWRCSARRRSTPTVASTERDGAERSQLGPRQPRHDAARARPGPAMPRRGSEPDRRTERPIPTSTSPRRSAPGSAGPARGLAAPPGTAAPYSQTSADTGSRLPASLGEALDALAADERAGRSVRRAGDHLAGAGSSARSSRATTRPRTRTPGRRASASAASSPRVRDDPVHLIEADGRITTCRGKVGQSLMRGAVNARIDGIKAECGG